MHNLQLNPSLCSDLGLPLELCYGKIDKVDLTVPWRALATEAVEVRVEGVVMVLRTVGKEGWKGDKEGIIGEIREKVEFEDGRLKIKEGKSDTSFGSLTEKIIRNLQIEIRNVHIRLESEDCHCTIGCVSELITCAAPISSASEGFSKAISIGIVYFYAESADIKARNREKTEDEKDMEELTCRFLCGEESSSIICPLSLEAELSSQNSKYAVQVTIQRLDVHLSQAQYQCISRVLEAVGEFSAFQAAEKQQLISQYRIYLESDQPSISHKQTFKSIRNRIKSGKIQGNSEDQYRYDAIIATTPEEEILEWLLELNGEIALRPTRFAWITSWFTGNRAMDPTPEISEIDTSTALFEAEISVNRVKITLQGRRTTCSEYIYRLEVDAERLGGLFVQQARDCRLAMHVRTCEVRFQDPISLNRFPLFQFLSTISAEEQLFLTLNQHLSPHPKTTISLELESFQLLFSLNILIQLQSFFATAAQPVPASQTGDPQLQRLWQTLDLDLHVKPWELVLLADETKPSLHLLMSVGDTTLAKIANVAREEEGLKLTNERIEMTVISWNLVLVNTSLLPVPLFSLSQRVVISLLVDQSDFRAFMLIADLPKTQIHLSNPTLQQLTAFISLLSAPFSLESPYIDTRKRSILSRFHPDKHFGMVWRHYQLAWHSYFTVLASEYLYFFTSPEEKEASMYFAVGNCEVRDPVTERLLQGMEDFEPFEEMPAYQVIVISRNGERSCRLGFENAEKCKEWVAKITKICEKQPISSQEKADFPIFPCIQVRLTLPIFDFSMEIEPSKPFIITLNDAEIAAKLVKSLCEVDFQGKVGVSGGNIDAPLRFRELISPISPIKLSVLYDLKGKSGLNVSLEAEKMELYWNHEVISSFMKAFLSQESQSTEAKPQSPSISMQIAIKYLHFTLNNEPKLFTFSELQLSDLHLSQNSSETELKLSSISIFDVSNYPESALFTENQPPRRFPILKTTGKSPISLSIINNHLTACLSHIDLVYIQQPFLRILNTFLYHIPSILSP